MGVMLGLKYPDAFSLAGETALITGGGTGLGRAMAAAFVACGAKVVLTGRRAEPLEATCSELGEAASYAIFDVAESSKAEAFVAGLLKKHGFIAILVNNAGNHFKKSLLETGEEEFRHLMDTHVTGAWALAKAMAPSMIEAGRGNVIFTASMASLFGIPKVFAYTTAKSAIAGMVRSLAVDLSPKGIRVNAIAPGFIETAISRKAMEGDPERKARVLSRNPMNRMGTTEEIGWATAFLCTPAASYINGVVLPVDGGMLIGF
jgi:gluconate 5-dehydrogenase